jgi:hypothetical protein
VYEPNSRDPNWWKVRHTLRRLQKNRAGNGAMASRQFESKKDGEK